MGFLTGWKGPSHWDVVVEDDDRVAYAYLRDDEHIVGDVWLYNVVAAPSVPPWRDADGPDPVFCNPALFLTDEGLHFLRPAEDELSTRWKVGADGALAEVVVLVQGRPLAWLAPGRSPGWSSLAAADGPLALRGPPAHAASE